MTTPMCPFHVECSFFNVPKRTPSDTLLWQFFCLARYGDCEIAKRRRLGKQVPVGACPDGDVKG